MVAAHVNPSRLRRWWPGLVVAVVLLVVVGAGAAYWIGTDRSTGSRVVAIVNEDSGTVTAGKQVRTGDQVVASLQESDAFAWEVVDADAATDSKYLASVTIPEDFSATVASLGTTTPRQAQLSVHRNGGSAADADAMSALTATVSEQTGANGIKNLLSGMSSARSQLQQTLLPAQLLATATGAADTQAQQLLGSVDSVLPYLKTANDGANQLVDVAGKVSGMVGQASGPAGELSTRLTSLGVTIGDLTTGTARLQGGLGAATKALRASGLDAGNAAGALERTVADLGEVSSQLTAVTKLLGSGVGPDTDLGDALSSGFGQLRDVSAQLSSAGEQLQAGIGPIAQQAPQMLGETKNQILAGITQLKTVSAQLNDQLGKGVGAIPVRNAAQQQQISTVLSAPVSVVETGGAAGPGLLTARNAAIGFAATTLLLACALGWSLRRGRPVSVSAESDGVDAS
ncbi:hypothetical protein FK531_10020 [Rhodococcus spelaei]|uniref:Uncharacterized protein n=1 Tax=Rhodococcus spelaei TaxID=2546320 RepID=A0A541BA44_9NOCA|nr:hypothetical protein [Rhodococcus spelaei]TQF69098.1 hypothetical protein FK531_10020 [Rhodococcus spelaei]